MLYALVTVLVLLADQFVKYWTTSNIQLDALGNDCRELISGVIHMTNVHNTGAAYSILKDCRWLLVGVTAVFVAAIIILISREVIRRPLGKWAAVLVMAGALGNGIDRALYGFVVDMFEFEFFRFPVFNVADIFITVFGVVFCLHVIFYKETEEEKAAEAKNRQSMRLLGRKKRESQPKEPKAPKEKKLSPRKQAALEREQAVERLRSERLARESDEEEDESAIPEFDGWQVDSATEPVSGQEPVFEFNAPMQKKAAPEPAPEPEAPPAEESVGGESDSFDLESILAEFGGDDY